MPEVIHAWKRDAAGLYIEMEIGEKKDYSHDFIDATSVGAISEAPLTLPAQIAQIAGPTEIDGKLVKFWLHAIGPAGVYACSLKIKSGNLEDIVPFRVVVK